MKKFFSLLIVSSLLLFFSNKLFATHVAGGQVTYKFISSASTTSHTYEVQIILFADCSGAAFSSLATSTYAGLDVFFNSGLQSTQQIPRIYPESDILISPVCATSVNSTTCTSGGTLPGIKKFTYRGNITLNGNGNWRFAFNGNHGSGSAGRSGLANNANSLGTMMVAATLNNTNGQNTSPTFTSDPTPFFCNNQPSSFSLGAVEPDGDNMTYSLERAETNTAGTSFVNYINPYTYTTPLNAQTGTFNFGAATGVTEFTPVIPGSGNYWYGIVVNKVTEKRNGVEVGTAAREMLFVYINNCQNTPPSSPIGTVTNGELMLSSTANSYEFKACEAQQVNFQYTVSPVDANGDNITISSVNIPTGATLNITGNGTQTPSLNFNWNLATVPAGTYQFFITYKDDGCPMSSVKTVTYTIYVQAFNGNFLTNSQPPCKNEMNGKAWINRDTADTALYKYTWMDPAFNVLQQTAGLQSQGDTLSGLLPGAYLVEAENYRGCKRRFTVIVDTPDYQAYFESDSFACINTMVAFNPNFNNADFVEWNWDYGNGTTSTNQVPAVSYTTPGIYTITFVGTTAIGCKDTFSRNITVFDNQHPEFELDKNSICVGEGVNITTSLGDQPRGIKWNFGDGGSLSTGNVSNMNYAFPKAGTYTVGMTVSYIKCPDVTFNRTVVVNDYPKVNLGDDDKLCYQGEPILLKNLETNQNNDRFLWNTGEKTSTILAKHDGQYSLTLTRNECSTTDTVNIAKDCYVDFPNAFVPGSGDVTGYFFPRQLLSQGASKFEMTVFNRWGQVVFKTNKTDGRGWDGTLNGKAQPAGVYVYQIDITFNNGKSEKYQGNVTLMR
ncbi:MAG TPA: gliding motility-associated C-terminal domain-containing protein [Edaphocola sp.]|nr:gliding motility-associated C-terminal domain-containing protein [Edaphocola sp.]